MSHQPLRVGLIGCGNVSGAYIRNAKRFRSYEFVAVADTHDERAREAAKAHGKARAVSVEAIYGDPEVEAILSLTPPAAHAQIALRALEAGKHIYTEKPLAVDLADGRRILDAAAAKNLRVACAPDTVLGPGLQTCRRMIDAGDIGSPTSATGVMMHRGPDSWHPDPEFFFKKGGGPLFDMGPYYLAAMIQLLGPIASVTAAANIALPLRTIKEGPKRGQTIEVETPTHIACQVAFCSGAMANLITSFDVWSHTMPCLEFHGTEGSLHAPDPNGFGGPVRLYASKANAWRDVPITGGIIDNARGLGLADLARAVRLGGPHRAAGDVAFHVLETMHAILKAAETGQRQAIQSTCMRPEALPEGWEEGAWLSGQ